MARPGRWAPAPRGKLALPGPGSRPPERTARGRGGGTGPWSGDAHRCGRKRQGRVTAVPKPAAPLRESTCIVSVEAIASPEEDQPLRDKHPRENILMLKNVAFAVLLAVAVPVVAQTPPPAKRSEAEKKALEKLTKLGASAMELAQNDPHLEVAYHLMDKEIT